MRIARVCYYLYRRARSFSESENLLLIQHLNDTKIGNINHSRNFPSVFLKSVAEIIQELKIEFNSSNIFQTGFKPALAITADLATFRLKCRHFMASITCIPDSEKLIQVVYLGQPVIGPRKGLDLATQIKTVLDKHRITAEQIESAVYDGAYHHDHVPEHLDCLLGVNEGDIHHAYDHMHKSALENKHIMKLKEFHWVVEVCDTLCESLKKI